MSENERNIYASHRGSNPMAFSLIEISNNMAKMFVTKLFILLKLPWGFYKLLTFD